MSVFCTFSGMLLDLMAYYLRNWRQLYLYLALPNTLLIAAFILLPESPRWLASKGKYRDVEKVRLWLTNGSNIQSPRSGQSTEKPSKTVAESSKKNVEEIPQQSYSYWDMIRNRRTFVFTFRIALLWSMLPVLYYTIAAQSLGYGGSMYFDYLVASLADIPALFSSTYFSNRFGRKVTIVVCVLGTGLLIGVVPFIPKTFEYHHTIVLLLTGLLCSIIFIPFFV